MAIRREVIMVEVKRNKDYPVFSRLEEFACGMCGAVSYTLTYCKGNEEPRWSSTYSRYITDSEECSEGVVGEHLHLNCDGCGYITIRKGVKDGTPNG